LYYNNDLYIDIMDIAPYLYITPDYKEDKAVLNIDANGVLVKHERYSNIDNLLAFREGRNYLLDIQMEQLKKRIEVEDSLRGIPYAKINNITDLEEYLNKHFSKIGELVVDIDVDDTIGKWLYLDISFPRSKSYRWYRLQRKEVEDWIWDMYTAILNLYDEEGLLHGAIRNPHYSRYSSSSYKNYVTFDTKDMDLYFNFSRSLLKKDYRFDPNRLTDSLNNTLNKYNKVKFDYEINQSGDDVDLIAYPDSNSVEDWSIYTKMGYLKRLNWEIRRVYPDLTVNGTLIFPKEDIEPIKFYFDSNKIRSKDLLMETETHLKNLYGSFSYRNYSYGLDFNIYEKDIDNLKLIVEGDFSIDDDKWINGGDRVVDRLNTRVQSAISTLISLWDMNISTEVLDNNGKTITEIDTYQKNVGIVYANPSPGEVKEGTLVYLYTDTSGADIYYTLDGSTPTRQSYKYTEPIVVSRDLTINAFGYKEGMGSGPIAALKYTVVPDDDWSYGLRNLRIDKGVLEPSFRRDVLDYEVNLDGNTNSITITPYADEGNITVDGRTVDSGEGRRVSLTEGRNVVNIRVKERDKEERIYTLTIYRGSSGGADIRIDKLNFSTTIIGVFKGQLTSNYVNNFAGYKIELLSKAGVKYKETHANSNGEFEITGFDIDAISKIIGYKYRVYDGAGNLVLENDL
ncbi:chitobiase/beta-hexosaminidase C-terminal domain-containing protein, partial [Schnuerera sp.]|uniref:chitobiase/beta-hexosaminidase C-terminal domain-containing protein n=1 Tax=Schnuerera sp. TaxID=2794844 RepID=UPI002D120A2F